jgi:cysteine desulfurase/selenocysteine lyase
MTLAYEAARRKVAGFVGGREEEIVHLAAPPRRSTWWRKAGGAANLKAGDRILLSTLEHHSNIVPWQLPGDRVGIEIDVCPLTQDGAIDPDAAEAMLTPAHKLVALAHVSNVLQRAGCALRGGAGAGGVGAKILIDGCQAVPRMAVDVAALGVDFTPFPRTSCMAPPALARCGHAARSCGDAPLAGRRLDDRPGEF